MRSLLWAAALLAFSSATAVADQLSCPDFRLALWRAIDDAGNHVAKPDLETLAFKRDDGTFSRYTLRGVVDLDGNLGCGRTEEMQYFEASASVDPDHHGALAIMRVREMASAACAAAAGISPLKCKTAVSKLSTSAISDYAKSFARGEPDPSAFTDEHLSPVADLEFYAAAGELRFRLLLHAR